MTSSKRRLLELKREKLKRKYPKLYVAKYHHVNVHNKPMSFGDKYRFLIPLYKMMEVEPDMCAEKAVQSGASEWFIVSALDDAAKGLRVLYVMPNIDLRGKFVKDRLDRLLKIVPYYQDLLTNAIGDSTSIGLKHFGKGIINFVGSNSEVEFISYPADALYTDEVDKCNQKNLEMAPDRLDHSDYKYKRDIGNPSIENWGIDKLYRESTQALWVTKCQHCGKQQPFNFFENIVRQESETHFVLRGGTKLKPQIICINKKCEKQLDRYAGGEYVHKYPKLEKKGVRISQIFSANVPLSKLVRTFYKSIGNPIKTQLFYNSKLGLPYSSEGSKITFNTLQESTKNAGYILSLNEKKHAVRAKRLYVGIDVGKYYNIVGRELLPDGTKRKLAFLGKTTSTKQIIKWMKIIKPKVIVIDKNPETREVERMKLELSKMFSCTYSFGKTFLDTNKKSQEYKKEREVKIGRTFLLDCVKSDFSNGIMINPSNAINLDNEEMEDYGEYYSQMLSSTRIFNEDNGRMEWRESGADHYFHAEAYCYMAQQIDDRILDYYGDQLSEFENKNFAEIEANRKKKEDLIPKTEIELRNMTSYQFLDRITNHTEEIVSGNKNKNIKDRCDLDD
jgi:hypothetical protein